MTMYPQVPRYLTDALRKQRYLHLCGAGVRIVEMILLYQPFLLSLNQHPLRDQPRRLALSSFRR